MKYKIVFVVEVDGQEQADNILQSVKEDIIHYIDFENEDIIASYTEPE